MSQPEIEELEHTLAELEQRILAKIGKWALAIFASCIALALMGAANWFGIVSRIERLETWKTERAVGVDEYAKFREHLEGRLTRIETSQEEILRLLRGQNLK